MFKTFVVFLLSFASIINATQHALTERRPPVQQSTPDSVMLTVTVRNEKRELVSGLKQEDFSVLVDKAPAKIHYFSDQDVPVSVGIL